MMRAYRVVEMDEGGGIAREVAVTANSPEEAAATVIGTPLIRAGNGRVGPLRVKVYFQSIADMTMVRFYEPVTGPRAVKG